jgi:hypothetical protein
MFAELKCITPAFDCLIGRGLDFVDPVVCSVFWFDESLFIWLPGPPLLLGPRGLLLFTTISPAEVTSA